MKIIPIYGTIAADLFLEDTCIISTQVCIIDSLMLTDIQHTIAMFSNYLEMLDLPYRQNEYSCKMWIIEMQQCTWSSHKALSWILHVHLHHRRINQEQVAKPERDRDVNYKSKTYLLNFLAVKFRPVRML